MSLKIINNKIKLYRRFEVDIWGFILFGIPQNKVITQFFNNLFMFKQELFFSKRNRFVYELEDNDNNILFEKFMVKRKPKINFLKKRISKLFYLVLSYKQFRYLAKKASRMEGSNESNYIMLIENRSIGVLYWLQFFNNIFELRYFILNGNLIIDNKINVDYNYKIKYFQIITVKKNMKNIIKYNFLKYFLLKRCLIFYVPNHLYVNYNLVFGFVYKEPKLNEFVYPNSYIDMYRVADLF